MTKLVIEHIEDYKKHKLPRRYKPRLEQRWVDDPIMYNYYNPFRYARGQAYSRKEDWEFTFELWVKAWGKDINFRGTRKGCKSMTRINNTLPWRPDNIQIVDRSELRSIRMSEYWAKKKA